MRKPQVVVVEDDTSQISFLVSILSASYDLFVVKTGAAAIEVIELKKPDLVLLDVVLPDISGLQVLEHLKAHNDPAVNTIPILIVSGSDNAMEEALNGGAVGFVTKPYRPALLMAQMDSQIRLLKYSTDLHSVIEEQTEKLRGIYTTLINIISLLVGERDGSTGDHITNVVRYMSVLLRHLDNGAKSWFPQEDIEYIIAMSSLHDIGKISISDTILCKNGPLTSEEFQTMQKHPFIGGQILRKAKGMFSDDVAAKMAYGIDMAECHHERFDGSGYPRGLSGSDIPPAARVLHLCDIYEAITAERHYKKAFTHMQAFDMIVNGDDRTKPTHFDPHVLRAFIRAEKEFAQVNKGLVAGPRDAFQLRGKDRRK